MPINLLIADDHQIVIDGIKSILEEEESVSVIAEASNGEEVLAFLRSATVDIAIVDINMPKMSGIEVTKVMKEKYPEIKVLILTMYNNVEFIKNLMEVGADGFILKNTGKIELLTAIEQLQKGDTYFGQEVTQTLAKSYQKENDPVVKLTRREKEVLQLLADGLTTSELAEKLFISKHTADSHRQNLMSKLEAKNTATLLKKAFQKGFIKYDK